MIAKYIYTALIGLSLVFCGCTNWLDVTSKSEVEIDEMFETSEGYYSTITGLYVNMGSSNLYGGNMTIDVVEPLGQQYLTVSNTEREAWINFDYSNSTYEKNGMLCG
ncbi:MAG: hypothetical protein LIO65_05320 [Odoribacter sp.]|nr:hypothetical protein [Odoribacter sp.]